MLIEQTLSTLGDLKLTGMKMALERQLEQPKTHQLAFEERLGLLVDYEKTHRQDRKIERLLKVANLRQQAYIEDIDYAPNRGIRREEISSFMSGKWVKEAFNLMITGPTGTGKSWLACALGRQACRIGLSVLYVRLSRLLEELRLSRIDGTYVKTLARLLKVDLLIIDDWGLERPTQEQRKDILEVVEDRHQAKSLLITSQLPTQKWHEMIADPTIADAILDRLLEKSFKLELKGESMRKRQESIVA